MMPLTGPASFASGDVAYEPTKVTYCAKTLSAGATINRVRVSANGIGATGSAQDITIRNTAGCYDLTIGPGALNGSSFMLILETGGAGVAILETVISTWGPTSSHRLSLDAKYSAITTPARVTFLEEGRLVDHYVAGSAARHSGCS